jgi:hypothetical protein|tara:strand:+ start:5086 stop:5829 length:744 start_codon:yes stop_codon:yes gene_type:complete
MKYLYNIGCSFSEGNGIAEDQGISEAVLARKIESEARYSAVMAKKLGLIEINEANGGGSNQRIFRKVWNWIAKNPELLFETIFVIQWSYPLRAEYYKDPYHRKSQPKWHYLEYKAVVEDRMKMWREEPELIERWEHENRFKSGLDFEPLSPNSASNVTLRYILSLQSFFKENDVKFIFFEGDDTEEGGHINFTSNLGKLVDTNHWILESFVGYSGKELTLNNHPNKKMQILWAEKLEKFIKDKNWLS